MNLSLDITPVSLRLIAQETVSYEDMQHLELFRIPSSTFAKLVLDDCNDPKKMNDNYDIFPFKNDVLFGRKKESLNHVGNKRFRVIISARRKEYQACTSRDSKTRITDEIIMGIHECGGRFLEKNEITDTYEVVSDKRAHEKVSHALRQAKDPNEKKVPRNPRKIVRKLPTPQENTAFDFIFIEQQRIFQEMLAEQYAIEVAAWFLLHDKFNGARDKLRLKWLERNPVKSGLRVRELRIVNRYVKLMYT